MRDYKSHVEWKVVTSRKTRAREIRLGRQFLGEKGYDCRVQHQVHFILPVVKMVSNKVSSYMVLNITSTHHVET